VRPRESHLPDNLLVFGRLLRSAAIPVHTGRLLDLIDAFACVNLAAREEVYHACRALLVQRHDQIALFDTAFAFFWREHRRVQAASELAARPAGASASIVQIEDMLAPEELQDETASGSEYEDEQDVRRPEGLRHNTEEEDSPDAVRGLKTWSNRSGLAGKDFAAFTEDELLEARTALSRLVWSPGERRTRRWVRGPGPRLDLRRAIAGSLRTGGDVVKLPRRMRRVRPRPLVLLCDVSGSMERYSRMLLQFAHAVARRHRSVETFLFATRLARVTRELRLAEPDAALAAVSRSVTDWSGGTRIGNAVKEFHQRWGRRVLHGGSVVLLISDGWDRGDPVELRQQIARLQRSCHRLIWLNPLIGTAGYAPLTRGLQAALPFVDDFLPARTLNNLADLAIHLNALA
jgi:uncharacterized protein with von Willebrand factor type A (vWA) domain